MEYKLNFPFGALPEEGGGNVVGKLDCNSRLVVFVPIMWLDSADEKVISTLEFEVSSPKIMIPFLSSSTVPDC